MENLILCLIMLLSFVLGYIAVDRLVRFIEGKSRKNSRSGRKRKNGGRQDRFPVAWEGKTWYINDGELEIKR